MSIILLEIPRFKPLPSYKRIVNFEVLRLRNRLTGKQGAFIFEPSATGKTLTLTGGEFL
jgi:hypothetical protein